MALLNPGTAVGRACMRRGASARIGWACVRTLVLLSVLVAAPAPAAELRVGAALPHFTLPDSRGHLTGPEELQARVVIIEFWATWCAPCRTLLPALARIARGYAPHARLVAINIDRDRAAADRFLEQYLPDGGATLLFDPDNRLMADWGAPGMPAIYIAVSGIVRVVEAGYSQEKLEAIETFLRDTLGQPPATPTF